MKKTYGLIGYPVHHSLSAVMQNAAFKHLGIDAGYKLFEVRPDELSSFYSSFKERFSGINITIPHKETSIKYMDDIRDGARSINAINTVVLRNGRLIGYNTDEIGFIKSLKDDLNFIPASKDAFIFGAGGAARAVCFGLFGEKARRLTIADIDNRRSISLAADLKKAGCNAIALEYDKEAIGELLLNSDLLVNATPCGMKGDDPELMDANFLHKRLTVFDLIYNPKETPLIRKAKEKNCRAINGLGMLLYQGAASFELWTEEKAPVDVMREALRW